MAKSEKVKIQMAKLDENAIIPSREIGNVGYDIYACFPQGSWLIKPHTTEMIPTGICSKIPAGYAICLWDRGSTGSKCMPTACGVIDSNFRGEWFVALHNDSNDPIIIRKKEMTDEMLKKEYPNEMMNPNTLLYPYEKAITQAIVVYDIPTEIDTVESSEITSDKTNRNDGKIGSTGK